MSKLMALCIDGATWNVLNPLFEQNRLPNLQKLQGKAELQSTQPPLTCPAWNSIITGKNPGKIGVYRLDNLELNSYETHPVNSKFNKGEVWNLIDKKSIVVGVPSTYPPKEMNGCMVTGPLTPDKTTRFYHPDRIKTKLDNYIIDRGTTYKEGKEREAYKNASKMEQERFKVMKDLKETEDWQFFMGHFLGTDRFQHHFYTKKKLLYKLYEEIDSYIGELSKDVDNLIVFSDHGFGKAKARFFLNTWLEQKGYLTYKNSKPQTTQATRDTIKKLLPDSILNRIVDHLKQEPKGKGIDWEHTQAFGLGGWGQIFINSKQKRPKGIVDNERQVINNIKKDLKQDFDNIEIHEAEEMYSGDYVDKAPAIYFQIENGSYSITARRSRELVSKKMKSRGCHRRNGILLTNLTSKVNNPKVTDLTPTILNFFDKKTEDVDGQPLC